MRWKKYFPSIFVVIIFVFFGSQFALIVYNAKMFHETPQRVVPKNYQCTTVRQNPETTVKVGKKVKKIIYKLQNPKQCKSARKLICILLAGGCGHGCLIHHIGICLFLAIGTNRTLQLHFDTPTYTKDQFESAYLPLSETCNEVDEHELATSPSMQGNGSHETTEHRKVVKLEIEDAFIPFTNFAPLTIPTQLKSALDGAHDRPHHWWIGHVLAYVTRVQPSVKVDLKQLKRKLGFSNPAVGLHIRRSDKIINEAEFYSLEDYMYHVTNLLGLHRAGNSPKNVFLATDDPSVYKEALRKYPTYNIMTIHENSLSALWKRDKQESFFGIVHDLQLLSECDQFVGTFSSNVGRLVYSLMLVKSRKKTLTLCSLDDDYMYYKPIRRYQEVLTEHKPTNASDEIELQVGDLLYVNPSYYKCDQRCFGTNTRSRKTGFYPADKVKEYAQPVMYQGFDWDNNL